MALYMGEDFIGDEQIIARWPGLTWGQMQQVRFSPEALEAWPADLPKDFDLQLLAEMFGPTADRYTLLREHNLCGWRIHRIEDLVNGICRELGWA